MKYFIVLPHQLFEDISIIKQKIKNKEVDMILLVEESILFGIERKLNINKIRLAYMVASLYFYKDYLDKMLLFNNLLYLKYKEDVRKIINYDDTIIMYDPVDVDIIKKYENICKLVLLETPQFILSNNDLQIYNRKKDKNKALRHSAFFNYVKDKLNILQNVKSKDKYNRKTLPKSFSMNENIPKYNSKYYEKAIIYVNNEFKNNIGDAKNVVVWPINFIDSKQALNNFIVNKFKNYGKYQDAIDKDYTFLYHSAISPMLNNGLLTPHYVLNEIMDNVDININSLEGFIRQLIGWREYMRFLYIHRLSDIINSNHFGNNRTFKDFNSWYNGTTGLGETGIIDNEIKKTLKYGYAHHIIRLMVFLNIMVLLRIHPVEIYKWFMEVVSIDAYDWVMKTNIYCMGYFYDKAMSKPYISSGAYLQRMSNYSGREKIWDDLFYQFIWDNKYRSGFYKKFIDKSSANIANDILDKYTLEFI